LSAFFSLLPPIEVQIVHLVFLVSCKDCHFGLVVQVKAHLSVGEYKGFLECMRGLKNQTINMSNLLQLISNLFSAPERLFLLCRFIWKVLLFTPPTCSGFRMRHSYIVNCLLVGSSSIMLLVLFLFGCLNHEGYKMREVPRLCDIS
jgi:hypothetical protein